MYRGFRITNETIVDATSKLLHSDQYDYLYNQTLKELEKKKSDITARIANIIKGDSNGIIDGEALKQACMPTSTDGFDIFVSHSHLDKDNAKGLAAYLKIKYGINCFVDDFVWGSCDKEMLKPLDKKYCISDKDSNTYSYEKRNYSTSHVHAMLSMAILEMIDQCECCLFIQPDNDYSVLGINDGTLSAWIYEEITFFNKIEKNDPTRTRRMNESYCDKPPFQVRYRLDLSDMPELKKEHLQKYLPQCPINSKYTMAYMWLDYLYETFKI